MTILRGLVRLKEADTSPCTQLPRDRAVIRASSHPAIDVPVKWDGRLPVTGGSSPKSCACTFFVGAARSGERHRARWAGSNSSPDREKERGSVSASLVFGIDTSRPPRPSLQYSREGGVPARLFVREAHALKTA